MPTDTRNGRKGSATSSSGFLDAAQRFWSRSYAGDYLGLAILIVLYIPLKIFDEPFHQMFRLSDSRIQHPHAEVERVGVGRHIHSIELQTDCHANMDMNSNASDIHCSYTCSALDHLDLRPAPG